MLRNIRTKRTQQKAISTDSHSASISTQMKRSFFCVLTASTIVFLAVVRGLNFFTSLQTQQSRSRFQQFDFPTRCEDEPSTFRPCDGTSALEKETGYVAAAGRMNGIAVVVRSGGPALKVVDREEMPPLLVQANRTSTEVYEDADMEEKDESQGAGGLPFAVGRTDENCDVFSGTWVRDESSRPLYTEEECPFINSQMRCLAHGRPEKGYQFWRWQPHGCSLPSFNATVMLEKLRGKRMLFVGDSLGASQFFSMACLVHKEKPLRSAKTKNVASLQTLRSDEYNATVEFYWAPFLLTSNCDNSGEHRVSEGDRMIHLYSGALEKHADEWRDADVLIFNTYTWWNTRTSKIKTLRSESNMTQIKEMHTTKAYRQVMKKMVKWVEKNMDPRKTRVFFTSMSPTHWRSQEWGGKPNRNCYGETTPIENQTYWGSGSSRRIMRMIRKTLGAARVPIGVINITQLSEYRRDAHTTIYKEMSRNLTRKELDNPRSYSGCVHWCVPGVQDTWNELLYTKLFFPN